MEVRLGESVRENIKEISKDYFPNEASALLVGGKRGERVQVKKVVEAENVLESPTTFKIEPEFVVEVLERAEEEGLELVGFFHSHPGLSAFVSARDKKFMKLWLEKIWVIAGTDEGGEVTEIKAFRRTDAEFEEIEIRRD